MKQLAIKASELTDIISKIRAHYGFDPTLSFRHVSEEKYANALENAETPLLINDSVFANYICVDEDVIVYFKKTSWEELPKSVRRAVLNHRFFREKWTVKKHP